MSTKTKKQSGMITVEMFLMTFSMTVVMIVVLSVTYGALYDVAKKSGFNKLAVDNSSKTTYASYSRDYESSTVDVK